jgi:hypothetical protein
VVKDMSAQTFNLPAFQGGNAPIIKVNGPPRDPRSRPFFDDFDNFLKNVGG